MFTFISQEELEGVDRHDRVDISQIVGRLTQVLKMMKGTHMKYMMSQIQNYSTQIHVVLIGPLAV